MKHLALIMIGFVCFNLSNAQFNKDAFRADICNCLEQEKLKLRLNENTYKKCFQEVLPNYAVQIDAEIEEEDVTKRYTLGQLARRDMMMSFEYELIYTCDTYYEFIESLRTSKKLIARENAKESDLGGMNQQVAMRPNAMTYAMRAELQFKLGNLKEAEADIKKSLEVNPNSENKKSTRRELLLLAWIYEEQERYSEAVELYDNLYLGVYDTKVAILRALADKKDGGTFSSITLVKNEDIEKKTRTTDRGKLSNNKNSTQKSGNRSKKVKKEDTSSLRKLLKIDN